MTTTNQSKSNDELGGVREKIREIEDKTLDGNYIFRGEPKCYTEVSSGLWRGYRQILRDELDIELIQREMVINHARQHLSGSISNNDFGSGHSDLQILIQLQHYGGKTNLIDFTTDARVALFFACDGFHDEVGRVILRKREDTEGLVESPWEPNEPIHRVVSQRSIFVRPNKGYLIPDPDSIVKIPDALKVPILKYLQKYSGISARTIYNDLHGYIRIQARESNAVGEFYAGVSRMSEMSEASTPEEKHRLSNEAIAHFGETVRINPYFASAYLNRSSVYLSVGDRDRAIEDLGNAIDADPYRTGAYATRGSVYYWGENGKEKLAHVIQDLNKAVQLGVGPKFQCLRAWTWLRLEEWEEAKSDFAFMQSLNYDFMGMFYASYKSIEDFEQRYDVQLPEDIAVLLTPA